MDLEQVEEQSTLKNNRNGQAEILTTEQLEELLAHLPHPHRLIAAICYYATCRVSEAIALAAQDIRNGRVMFRKANTKTKKTKEVSIPTKLQREIDLVDLPTSGYLFPGKQGGHITRQSVDEMLRQKCDYLGFAGVSTHSFRRSSITSMYRKGIDLKTIQQRSGHASLTTLAFYIEGVDGAADAAGELL
jgi:integrase/recombinase XerD